MDTTEIITAINAYADAQQAEATNTAWLALVHRSNRSAAADVARAIRTAGRDALDIIQDWPTIATLDNGACILQAPDGTQVRYLPTVARDNAGGMRQIERVEVVEEAK